MSKKSWKTTIVALIAAALLSICGVIYYGTVVQPGERRAADRAACDSFALGLTEARNNAIAVAERTPPGTDQQVADKYLKSFDKGLASAFDLAAKNGDVYKSMTQLGLARLSYDASMGMSAVTAIEGQFTNVTAACSVVEPTPTASASPTN